MKKILATTFLCFASLAFALQGKAPYFNAALSSTAVRASASPAYLSSYNLYNPNTSVVFVQFFDAATTGAVTVGSTTPLFSLSIPAKCVLDGPTTGQIPFSSGMVIAATTTATGSGTPSTALVANVFLQ